MAPTPRLGKKIRASRLRAGLTQSALADRIAISASYLNLIEHDRRPLGAHLLLRLAHHLDLDLKALAAGEDTELTADLLEVFGDPVFESRPLPEGEVREFVAASADVARAVVHLHHAYSAARASADALAEQVLVRQDAAGLDLSAPSSELVSDLIQRHMNHFPELELEAERVWRDGRLEREKLFGALSEYLQVTLGVRVRILKVSEMSGTMRRYDKERRELLISEVLRRGSRNFQLAHQIGLLRCPDIIDRIAADPALTTDESRALCRVALANYFAGAVLMPYDEFLPAAEEERYDLELLGHRFRASFEQVCHRLTTLQRPGVRGVPFDMVRVDMAGNISKKFSATGIRFPRFGGLCPLWNVHAAFLQPGMVRSQIARLPDGTTFFSVARTVRKPRWGHHAPDVLSSIGLACDIASARKLVYAAGMDLGDAASAVPVGITCRLCERMDCEARAFPSLRNPLKVDENVRGVSFFAPVRAEEREPRA